MKQRWVLDYPEAAAEKAKYDDLIDILNREKTKINAAANLTIEKQTKLINDLSLSGDYYEVYKPKVDEWYKEEQRIVNAFSAFEIELSTRIANAISKAIMWANRENIGHWEEDAINGKSSYSSY